MSSDIDFSQFMRQPGQQPGQSNPEAQPQEIDFSQFKRKPERSIGAKAGRLAGQTAIGLAEGATMPYNLAAIGASMAANMGHEKIQENAKKELEILKSKKEAGTLNHREAKYFDRIKRLAEEGPRKTRGFDVGSLLEQGIEKATGVDLRPQGIAEHGLRFAGMLKNPSKVAGLGKMALDAVKDPRKAFQLGKTLAPGGKELARGFGAGIALDEAQAGNFGPIGTIAATVLGDLAGGGIYGGVKGLGKFLKNPKQGLANLTAKLAKKSETEVRKQIINDFRNGGVQADIGSITGSNLLKSVQAKLSASGLTGEPLERLRKEMTAQITDQYKAIADGIGELKHSTNHEIGEAVQNLGKQIRDTQKAQNRALYEAAEIALPENAKINSAPLALAIQKLEKKMTPGALKSPEQKAVLKALDDMKADLFDAQGVPVANVKALTNMKKAINDIVDFEVQGGQKQLLRGIGHEVDKLLEGYGAVNRDYGKKFRSAQEAHAKHAQTFRDNAVETFLRENTNPARIMDRMNNVHEIRQIKKALSSTPEGRELFDQLRRYKLEQMVGEKMTDSVTNQLKHGTFAKLLEKGQNEAVVGELLGQDQLKRLQHLQKASSQLAESAQKFLNTSQSATSALDVAAYTKIAFDLGSILSGNFWPIIRTAGILGGSKLTAKLMADKEFLKLVEEAILARNNGTRLQGVWPRVLEKAKELGLQEARPAAHAVIEHQQEVE